MRLFFKIFYLRQDNTNENGILLDETINTAIITANQQVGIGIQIPTQLPFDPATNDIACYSNFLPTLPFPIQHVSVLQQLANDTNMDSRDKFILYSELLAKPHNLAEVQMVCHLVGLAEGSNASVRDIVVCSNFLNAKLSNNVLLAPPGH